jgi:hypothetical protein
MNKKEVEQKLHDTVGEYRVMWEIYGPRDPLKNPIFELVGYMLPKGKFIIIQYWPEPNGFQVYLPTEDGNKVDVCFENIKRLIYDK